MEEVKHGQNMPEQRSKQGSQGRLSEELVSSWAWDDGKEAAILPFQKKKIQGRGNSMCKGPNGKNNLAYLSNCKKTHWLEIVDEVEDIGWGLILQVLLGHGKEFGFDFYVMGSQLRGLQ